MLRKQQSVDGGPSYHSARYPGAPGGTHSVDSILRSMPEIPPSRLSNNPSRTSLLTDEGGGLPIYFTGSVASPQIKKRRQKRPSSATGVGGAKTRNREEVTPWEFQQAPPRERERDLHSRECTKINPPISPTRSSYDRGSGVAAAAAASPINRRPKTSSASLASVSFLSMSPSMSSSSSFCGMLTSTGPVAEVTPWELYPAPVSLSTSASLATASTDGEIGVASTSSLCPIQPMTTTNTGPLEEVTPWELAPGPEDPASSSKFGSRFKTTKPEPKRSTSLSTSPMPLLPDIPMDLLDTFGTMGGLSTGIPPVALQRSIAQRSATDPKQGVGGGFKWSRPGGKEGFSSNGERTRQLPLTGPVEEVAPWEMDPPVVDEVTKKLTISSSALAYEAVAPRVSPTIEMWKSQKSSTGKGQTQLLGYHYTRRGENGRMDSSSSSLRRRADSVADASSASLSLRSSGDGGQNEEEEEEEEVGPLRVDRGTASLPATSMVSTMNKAQMEEVTPWELCPVPMEEMPRISISTTSTSTPSSAAGKALVELGGLKKRRSGVGPAPGVGHVLPPSGTTFSEAAPVPPSGAVKPISNVNASFSAASAIGQTLLPISIAPSSSSGSSGQSRGPRRSTIGKEKGPTTTTTSSSDGGVDLAKFSTADRTILEELKANIRAREAQFVVKGVGHTMVGGRKCPGKKYHPHRRNEVPYPRSYDREVVDLDVWETMFWLNLCKGLSWHSFDKPPTKVLEIGCGTGTWILEAATTWKDCHFVGLDIVPLHPNLQNFASPDVTSRITWVQHNFLDGLPFQNEEFDFVHIKRIALGVPEDKWDKFLEEIQRVMKPGGALEMIEEDLFFPGKPIDDNDHESTVDVDASSTFTHETLVNGTPSLGHRPMPQIDEQKAVKSFSDTDSTREGHNTMGKLRAAQTLFKVDPLGISDNVAPRNPRDHTILDAIWRGMLESRFVNSTPLSLLPTYLDYHFQDVRTHPPLLYSFPPLPKPAVTAAKDDESPSENKTADTSQPAAAPPYSPVIKAPSVTSFESANHLDDGPRLSTNPPGKHRPLYVVLDETRSDALSPSDLAHSPRKSKSHFATLPDRTLSIDIRTLNLHLSLRAKEVVACSEPMWEWVKEFQTKQARKQPRALHGRDADVLVKDAILEMTREDFDQVLTNFQLDIQDKAGIKDALEQRFDWQTFTSEPLQDRKAFDSACQRYDEWLANETRDQFGRVGHSKHIFPIAKGAELPADVEYSGGAYSMSTVHSRLPRQLLSCQQLSRAMRVFVAWKESA